jgi:hypothetical protein
LNSYGVPYGQGFFSAVWCLQRLNSYGVPYGQGFSLGGGVYKD